MATQKIETGLIADDAVTSAKIGTLDANLEFGDSVKAIFGAGSDLQIFHDSSNSYINDVGTGSLYIKATNLSLSDAAGEQFLNAYSNGGVVLYCDNAEKLATTSTGIDVTGTVVADGLTVDTSTLVVDATNNRVGIGTTSPNSPLHVKTTDQSIQIRNTGNANVGLEIYRDSDGAKGASIAWGNGNANLEIKNYRNDAQSTGPYANIDFFTGGTDADSPDYNPTRRMRIQQTGEVGIGVDDPLAKLHVEGTGDSQILIYETGTSPYTATLKLASQSTTAYGANVQYTSGAEQLTIENFGRTISSTDDHGSIRFRTKVGNSSMQEVLHINGYTGNVGIGTSSPTDKLHVVGTSFLNGNTYVGSGGAGNLYLSAGTGIYMDGGTGSANHLDDYEEGTWSPTLANAYNITSLTLTEAGRFTKIGNLVHLEFQVTGSFTNAAVESRFSFTLPFNTATTSSRATGMFAHHLTTFSNGRFNNGQVFQGTATDTALWVYVSTNQLSGIGSFNGRGTVTYVSA